MKENFDRAIEFVLKWEGGYVNDPADPGGETKFGISKRAFPKINIKDLTKEQAIAIYRNAYWKKCGCDDMPYPLDIIVFDTAVNCGAQRALTWHQEYPDWREYLFKRIEYYVSLSQKNSKFLKGWLNRVIDLWRMVSK